MVGNNQLVHVSTSSLDDEERDRIERRTARASGKPRTERPRPAGTPMREDIPLEKPVRRSLEWSRRRTSDSPWYLDVHLDYMAEKAKERSGADGMEISPLRLQWVAGEPLGAAPGWKDTRVIVESFVAEEKFQNGNRRKTRIV